VVWTVVGALLLVGGAIVAAAGLGAVPRVDRGTTLLAPALLARWRGWQPWSWWAVILIGLLVATFGMVWARAQLRRRGGPALSDLADADLAGTDLAGTDLAGADLAGADLPALPSSDHPTPTAVDSARSLPLTVSRTLADRDGPVPAGREVGVTVSEAGRLPGRTRVRSGALVRGLVGDLSRHARIRRAAVELTGDATEPRVWARLDVKDSADMGALHEYVAASLKRFTATTGLRLAAVQVVVQIREGGERVR
jgi:hypothetical protein